jgi:hypothetical protein
MDPNRDVICECGSQVRKTGLKAHKKTRSCVAGSNHARLTRDGMVRLGYSPYIKPHVLSGCGVRVLNEIGSYRGHGGREIRYNYVNGWVLVVINATEWPGASGFEGSTERDSMVISVFTRLLSDTVLRDCLLSLVYIGTAVCFECFSATCEHAGKLRSR